VRGVEGALWYEDERDAVYVVEKLAGTPAAVAAVRKLQPHIAMRLDVACLASRDLLRRC